jgi:hypothetical protein
VTLALEINDAGLLVAGPVGLVLESPGLAVAGGEGVLIGDEARARAWLDPGRVQHDFWLRLDTSPLARPAAHAQTRADLVFEHLRQLWNTLEEPEEDLVLVVPGCYRRDQLALLLGILQRLSISVVGLVDAAVVATRQSFPHGELFHLDADLHRTVITPLAQDEQLRAGEPRVLEATGLLAAERTMTRAVAAEFVAQTRFDPLHQASGEQQIHDRLARILGGLQSASAVDVVLETGGAERRIKLAGPALVRALRTQVERIAAALGRSARNGQPRMLQLSHRLAHLPGLLETLAGSAAEVIVLERGAAATGALAWVGSSPAAGVSLPFVRAVPLPAPIQDFNDPSATDGAPESAAAPTHLLLGDTAYALGSDDLEIGRDPPAGRRSVRLAGAQPGVSRRHCSIGLHRGSAVVRDHSRFGTWVNERKVVAETTLWVGDRIRLGDAAQELRLIRVVDW